MKKHHVAAIVCFVIAVLLHLFASTKSSAAGFGVLGLIFELVGWSKLLGGGKK